MALGAQARDVLLLVVRQAMVWTLIGVTLSITVALWVTRWLESMLFGVSATDPLTYAMMTVLLTLVALRACWVPARRATNVDPSDHGWYKDVPEACQGRRLFAEPSPQPCVDHRLRRSAKGL